MNVNRYNKSLKLIKEKQLSSWLASNYTIFSPPQEIFTNSVVMIDLNFQQISFLLYNILGILTKVTPQRYPSGPVYDPEFGNIVTLDEHCRTERPDKW